MSTHRLIIIGLDAADFHLTKGYMDEGEMPVLSSLRARGCLSRLGSTVPPQTAPAWTTITTGVNPGRHGIYYFYDFSTSPMTIINSTATSTPRIWDYVGAADGESVVVNVPVTYPAQRIRGAIVAGIPPWYFDERSVEPKYLFQRLHEDGYEIDTPMGRGLERNPEELARRLAETERKRVEEFLRLLGEREWSFGMVVLTALDRLQHKVLGKGEREDKVVRKAYSEVDSLVGRMMGSLGGDVNYLVVSDHGFNARPLAFFPNSWLHAQGMLRRRSSLKNRLARVGHDVFDGHLLWLPQSVTKRFQGAATAVHEIDAVDLERSRAYVPGTDGVLVVKSKDDEKAIVGGLSGLKDDSGREVCRVYTRDQVYRGQRVLDAPEILIVPRDDVNIRTDPFSAAFLSRSGAFPKGNHSSNGIFLAGGPDVRMVENVDVAIEDVAPTALALMGIRPSEPMDGEAPATLLEPAALRLVGPPKVSVSEAPPYSYSEKEEKQVMESLKRLGYA